MADPEKQILNKHINTIFSQHNHYPFLK